MTWNAGWDNESGFAFGQDEVQDCEAKIPQHDEKVRQDLLELGSDSHCELMLGLMDWNLE